MIKASNITIMCFAPCPKYIVDSGRCSCINQIGNGRFKRLSKIAETQETTVNIVTDLINKLML